MVRKSAAQCYAKALQVLFLADKFEGSVGKTLDTVLSRQEIRSVQTAAQGKMIETLKLSYMINQLEACILEIKAARRLKTRAVTR